jgi:hypothetical protein
MWRFVCFSLLLMLAGCGGGYHTWSDLPFTTGSNPNLPAGDSENMRRVQGQTANIQPLTPEPGDVWPGPIKPPPTLQDLENQNGMPEQPSPLPPMGSSTPPGSNQPGLPPLPSMAPSTTLPGQSTSTGVPTAMTPSKPGQTYQTKAGAAVSTGGTSNYQTITTPGSAGQSIVVPNGNGTSTIIHPNGTVETVPTPK